MTEEAILIERAKKNDIHAFEELISPYTNALLNYIFRYIKNRDDAEDILQETYLKVYKSIKTFEGNSSFKTWLYRIATNMSIDYLRKNKRTESVSLNQTADDGEYELQIPDSTYSPEEQAKKNAALSALKEAMENMSDEHRTIITLRDIEGFSYDEIADVTKTTVGTVKSRISRARSQLKKLLEKNKELFL